MWIFIAILNTGWTCVSSTWTNQMKTEGTAKNKWWNPKFITSKIIKIVIRYLQQIRTNPIPHSHKMMITFLCISNWISPLNATNDCILFLSLLLWITVPKDNFPMDFFLSNRNHFNNYNHRYWLFTREYFLLTPTTNSWKSACAPAQHWTGLLRI